MPNPIGENKVLFEASGSYATKDRLVAFLYELLRDHVPAGVFMQVLVNTPPSEGSYLLTNGHLTRFVEHVLARLRKGDDPEGRAALVERHTNALIYDAENYTSYADEIRTIARQHAELLGLDELRRRVESLEAPD